MREVWSELQARGREPEWHQIRMIEQHSGHANWQHGETYVTARREKAAGYAVSNGAHGGELLKECAEALDVMERMDPGIARDLRDRHPALASMLAGGGTPILVSIEGVRVEDLQPEDKPDGAIEKSMEETVAEIGSVIGDPVLLHVLGSTGFRLRPGAGIVAAIDDL